MWIASIVSKKLFESPDTYEKRTNSVLGNIESLHYSSKKSANNVSAVI